MINIQPARGRVKEFVVVARVLVLADACALPLAPLLPQRARRGATRIPALTSAAVGEVGVFRRMAVLRSNGALTVAG